MAEKQQNKREKGSLMIEIIDLENPKKRERGLIEIIDLENPKKRERGSLKIEIIDLENPNSSASFGNLIDLTTAYDDDADEIFEIKSFRSIKKNRISGVKVTENRSGSRNKKKKVEKSFVCEICAETKMIDEAFQIKGCEHFYCSECMVRYVESKIQQNITSIGCPEMNCDGVLEPESCQSILAPKVFNRWGEALREALILGTQKFYCPFKDCSALLDDEGGREILQSKCPQCKRMFCAECKVPWHAGITCIEFQKLNVDERGREDILLMEAAKTNQWKRCPKCKIYVDRITGCRSILCRCGYRFCYDCGGAWFKNNKILPTYRGAHSCPLDPYRINAFAS
ncbi:hypothetical protein MKW94_000126 [Papaver nudicaule]|uniref:RBR-type E3 ubiquitin transferase n=1 Tax=Papaver nudicaule TaxID=74823 RepID=A0AA41V4C6_PAPNU|nr:hypothetical protein [Papaver nudicaule]